MIRALDTLHPLHGLLAFHDAKADLVCDELVARNICMNYYLVPDF